MLYTPLPPEWPLALPPRNQPLPVSDPMAYLWGIYSFSAGVMPREAPWSCTVPPASGSEPPALSENPDLPY